MISVLIMMVQEWSGKISFTRQEMQMTEHEMYESGLCKFSKNCLSFLCLQ